MTDTPSPASTFLQLFCSTYRLFQRRGRPLGVSVTPEGRALLLHLAWSGPMTVGELAQHTDRAQSVTSDSVSTLEAHGLLARVRDPGDRRRTLVWLTDAARQWLAEEQEPLDRRMLEKAFAAMDPTECGELLTAFQRFIDGVERLRSSDPASLLPESPQVLRQHDKEKRK